MRLQHPLFETPGDGGGGGAPSGGTPVSAGSTAPTISDGATVPTAHDFDPNALYRLKGEDKPFRIGERYVEKNKWTQATQRAAQLEKQYQELQQRYQQEQQARQQPQAPQTDPFATIEAMPYIQGKDFAAFARQMVDQIRQRDLVLTAALKQLQGTQQTVRTLHGAHSSQTFDAKIAKFLSDGGYDPKEYGDFAKELYLAYEGDDLDAEFPTILANRVGQLEKLFEAKRTAAIHANRRQPFVPGKGGSAGPSKPLQLKPNMKSRDVADALWNELQAAQGVET